MIAIKEALKASGTIVQLYIFPVVMTLVFVGIRMQRGRWSSGLDGLFSLATLDLGVVVTYLIDDNVKGLFSPIWGGLVQVYYLLIAVTSIGLFAFLIKYEDKLSKYNLRMEVPAFANARFPFWYWCSSWFVLWVAFVMSALLFFVR